MTMVALPSYLTFPGGYEGIQTTFAYDDTIIDAAAEKAAYVFQVPKSGNIRFLCYRVNTVTTGGTFDIRLETVGADGNPTGTLAGVTTNGSDTLVSGGADDNTWRKIQMTADYAATKGTLLALVVVRDGVAGNMGVARIGACDGHMAYVAHFTAAWAKPNPVGCVFGIGYSDNSYVKIPNTWPAKVLSSANINSGTTPDEKGNRFIPPFKMSVAGIWAIISGTGATGLFKLYDSTDVLLASVAFDLDQKMVPGTKGFYPLMFTAPVELDEGATYRVTILPDATNTSLTEYTVHEAGCLDATGGDQNCFKTSRTDAGAWTDASGSFVLIGVIIDGVDDGQGEGGQSMTGNIGKRCLYPGWK